MDMMNIMLMNQLSRMDINKGFYDIVMMVLLFSLINYLKSDNILSSVFLYCKNKIQSRYTKIKIIGWEFLKDGSYFFDYPMNLSAINYYIYINNKSNNFRYFDKNKNGKYYLDDNDKVNESDETPNYILNDVYKIKIYDDIYITVRTKNINCNDNIGQNPVINWSVEMSIISYNHNVQYVQDFINECCVQYNNYMMNRNKNKTYHFIYQGSKNNKLDFSCKMLSDYSNPELENHETFDNLFHSNKDLIMKDIDRLHNIEYYKKTGLKRKKGYLFYGKPGTGKTVSVMAMSNYDHRHIIEIPLNRIKTNNELENILTLTQINDIKFNPNNVIILFDEIDIDMQLNRNISETNVVEVIKKATPSNQDRLSLSTILSRLDGIGNYEGLIIVATSNNIDNIDKALYRDGRLSLINFDNATIDDIINITQKYYDCKIIDSYIEKINSLHLKISHATLRYKLEYFDNYFDFIDYLISNLGILQKVDTEIKPYKFSNIIESEHDEDEDEDEN